MRLVVDTGVFSAALSRRRRAEFDRQVASLAGNQIFLAASTVAELRFGALLADWGDTRRGRLEQAIETTTVVPVSDALLTTLAELRFACRRAGHPLADPVHANDLWIAALRRADRSQRRRRDRRHHRAGGPRRMTWAFSDESERAATMLFGVLLIEPGAVATSRTALTELLLPGQRRVHTAQESARRRRELLDLVAGLEADAIVLTLRRELGVSRGSARARLLAEASLIIAEREVVRWVVDHQVPARRTGIVKRSMWRCVRSDMTWCTTISRRTPLCRHRNRRPTLSADVGLDNLQSSASFVGLASWTR